jgi:hypothetical protein
VLAPMPSITTPTMPFHRGPVEKGVGRRRSTSPLRRHENRYLIAVLVASGVLLEGIWKETVLRPVPTIFHPQEERRTKAIISLLERQAGRQEKDWAK